MIWNRKEQSSAQTWSPSKVHCYLGSRKPLSAAREDRGCEHTVFWGENHPEGPGEQRPGLGWTEVLGDSLQTVEPGPEGIQEDVCIGAKVRVYWQVLEYILPKKYGDEQ